MGGGAERVRGRDVGAQKEPHEPGGSAGPGRAQRTSISWPGKAGDTYWSEAWLLCTALGRPCEGIVTVTSRSGGRRLAAPHAAGTAPTSATALGLRVITCVVLLVLGNLGLGQRQRGRGRLQLRGGQLQHPGA